MSVLSCLHARYSIELDRAAIYRTAQQHGGYWPVPDSTGAYFAPDAILQAVYAELRTVPGIHAKKTRLWYGPSYDVAWLVVDTLDGWQLPYVCREPDGLHHPRPFDAAAEAALVQMVREHPRLRHWLVVEGGPFQLTPFQREAIWYALERDGGLWDLPPGAGKTVCATVFTELGPDGAALHITKNAVTTQYARALAQFSTVTPFEMPSQSQASVRGGKRVPLDTLLTEYMEWCEYDPVFERYGRGRPHVVVGWDTLRHVFDALMSIKWSSVVFDESHNAANPARWDWVSTLDGPIAHPKMSRSYAAYALSQVCARHLPMSGTPQPNRRRDWYGQLTLASIGWEMSSGRFDKRYCGATSGTYGWEVNGVDNTAEFLKRKAFVVHTVPQDVVDAQLPPRRLEVIRVSAKSQDKTDPWFRLEIRRLAKLAGKGDLAARAMLKEIEGMEAAARKRSAAVSLVADHVGRRVAQEKQAAVEGTTVSANKGKVVVFTGRHADCWHLGEAVKTALPGVTVFEGVNARADTARLPRENTKGEMVVETREQWMRRVQEGGFDVLEGHARQAVQDAYMAHPGPCVLVATGQAWGTGLDLQDSDLLAIVYLPYSPGDLEQWMRRVQRLGMTRSCLVALLLADGTVDERRASILVDKTPDIGVTTGNKSLGEVRDHVRGYDAAGRQRTVSSVADKMQEEADHHVDDEMVLWESHLSG